MDNQPCWDNSGAPADGAVRRLLVHYGCGTCAPIEWRNFDISPTLRAQRLALVGSLLPRGHVEFPGNVEYGDVTKRLPVATASANVVYCSHTLEHLSLVDLRKALRETYRILRPGGVFRGVLPDLEYCARRYLSNPSPAAALTFMEETLLGITTRPRGLSGMLLAWLGNSKHLWMWDFKALEAELRAARFRSIRRAVFGDNPDVAFRSVEDGERWQNCLGFECCKGAE